MEQQQLFGNTTLQTKHVFTWNKHLWIISRKNQAVRTSQPETVFQCLHFGVSNSRKKMLLDIKFLLSFVKSGGCGLPHQCFLEAHTIISTAPLKTPKWHESSGNCATFLKLKLCEVFHWKQFAFAATGCQSIQTWLPGPFQQRESWKKIYQSDAQKSLSFCS